MHAKFFPMDICCQYRINFLECGMNGIMYVRTEIKVWVQKCLELTLHNNFSITGNISLYMV